MVADLNVLRTKVEVVFVHFDRDCDSTNDVVASSLMDQAYSKWNSVSQSCVCSDMGCRNHGTKNCEDRMVEEMGAKESVGQLQRFMSICFGGKTCRPANPPKLQCFCYLVLVSVSNAPFSIFIFLSCFQYLFICSIFEKRLFNRILFLTCIENGCSTEYILFAAVRESPNNPLVPHPPTKQNKHKVAFLALS